MTSFVDVGNKLQTDLIMHKHLMVLTLLISDDNDIFNLLHDASIQELHAELDI